MASKEATVFIVDVGSTMGERNHGRNQTNLDWALEYVWDRITSIVATARKTNMVGVIGLRTEETKNALEQEDEYAHIDVFQDICQMFMPEIRSLRKRLIVNHVEAGDATSAIAIAIHMISEACKKLQYIRRIVLVTDGRAAIDSDDMSQFAKKLEEDKIELTILGVDFDDAEYGFKEEAKPEIKALNEALFKQLCEDSHGNFGTLAQAIEELEIPRLKSVRPVATYKGCLTLGKPNQYDTALTIDVERYPKIMRASAPTASSFVQENGIGATQSTQTLTNGEGGAEDAGDGLSAVRNARTYQILDDDAPGGKRDIPSEELSKGYEYGRTAVHISESDRNVTTFETQPGLDIIGFVDKNQHEHYLDMSRASMIVSQRTNDKASMALSSLIHALYELESYAIARFVPKEDKEPKVLLLSPHIEPDFECLYDVELPYAEDMRSYRFPPLDRVVTVSGKQLSVHRNLPNDALEKAMSEYVDSMDLSAFGRDEEGEPAEFMPMDETYNPNIHRLNQVIKHRAVFPHGDPPPASDLVTKFRNPPEDLVERSRAALEMVIVAADIKKVPPKARGKRWSRKDVPKPLSDLDVAALLAQDPQRQSKKIDAKNAIPEFKQILEDADSLEKLEHACKQLTLIILDWIRHSVGDAKYQQALEAIGTMREEMNDYDEPGLYNDFLQELKKKILDGELGGDRKELWYRVRVNRLGPLTTKECQTSEMSEDEAKAFMLPR